MENFLKYVEEFRKAIFIRQFENKLLELFAEGKIFGTVHTCVGQELIPVFIKKFLKQQDYIFSNHRGHGHFISYTNEIHGLLAELLGKKNGVSGGIGGSQHLQKNNFFSNGIQGGLAPIAAGTALINKKLNRGGISLIHIGDGTLGQGVLYETFNICTLWKLPIIFILENNGYAQSTSSKQTLGGNLKTRIEGFGLNYIKTNIWDLDDLNEKISHSFDLARNNQPTFIDIECFRLNSHSKGDDNRDPIEITKYKEIDLISKFINKYDSPENMFVEKADEYIKKLLVEIEKEEDLINIDKKPKIYFEEVLKSIHQRDNNSNKRINELIYEGIKGILQNDRLNIFIGEDIEWNNNFTPKEYGGAFKVSRNLSYLFNEQVYNTPISEQAITGISIGIALCGHKSILEIMFGDFMTLTFDQIYQQASKLSEMYGKEINIPLIVRTPMGGRRGYGPTHSQSIEKYFMGINEVSMIAINYLINPAKVYATIDKRVNNPMIVIENKVDYTKIIDQFRIKSFNYFISNDTFPTLVITPDISCIKPDITIFCYGGMLHDVQLAADKLCDLDILCEIICPLQLVPFNIYPIVESVKKSKKLLTVEEGSNFMSLGSEIVSWLKINTEIDFQATTMGNTVVIPCPKIAEANLLPNFSMIINAVDKLLMHA